MEGGLWRVFSKSKSIGKSISIQQIQKLNVQILQKVDFYIYLLIIVFLYTYQIIQQFFTLGILIKTKLNFNTFVVTLSFKIFVSWESCWIWNRILAYYTYYFYHTSYGRNSKISVLVYVSKLWTSLPRLIWWTTTAWPIDLQRAYWHLVVDNRNISTA